MVSIKTFLRSYRGSSSILTLSPDPFSPCLHEVTKRIPQHHRVKTKRDTLEILRGKHLSQSKELTFIL